MDKMSYEVVEVPIKVEDRSQCKGDKPQPYSVMRYNGDVEEKVQLLNESISV